ncbi:MAG: DUF2807 domain-containing protein [Hyphomonadaceae bacterium]
MLRTSLLLTSVLVAAGYMLIQPASADTQTYDQSGFSALKAKQSIKVIYTASETFSVRADVENDEFDDLKISTKGDALILERPRRRGGFFGTRNRPDITVYVSAPTLSDIQISSSASFSGDSVTSDRLHLSASSSGGIEIASIAAQNLQSNVSSSGRIELAGTCTYLDSKASSSGRILATELVCHNVDIDASSSGKVALEVDGGTVDINLSSSGQADLTGTCDVAEVSVSSGADVEARAMTCNGLDARASSGANIEISITGNVDATASSGSDIDIYGSPTHVDERTSSGGDVDVHTAL